MRLKRPFYRLPVRFDVARLRAEVEALPEDAWSRHAQEYEGNTAVRLISVGGEQNDRVAGAMKPTPALLASPYLQQVLASFGTVWSRSRLMRIAGGGAVPEHSDVNHHWFYRVRVHIPIVTRPEVRFFCGDQSVHMAAGEAWIFDNWRLHKVLNPASDARIHLVADTSGTSKFWGLVSQAQSDSHEQLNPDAPLLAYDPSDRPKLLIERFNIAPRMPPAEVEQLAFDLLSDLAPVDKRPESAAAIGRFIGLVVDFCHDWRSLWTLFEADPAATAHYQRLAGSLRRQISQLPDIVVAGTNARAQEVLNSRLLAQLFGGVGAGRREAAEFNVGGKLSDGPAQQQNEPPAWTGFTGSLLADGSRDSIDSAAARGKLPVIDRPLIVLSAPRAGSTLLFETLAKAAGVHTIGGESHRLIEGIDALRPGAGVVASNRLTAEDATPSVVAELRRRFATALRDRDGNAPLAAASVRLLEKTPKNVLRLPFLQQVFPDARFIFLHRDPRASLSSMMEAWRSGGWVTYRRLTGWDGPWSMLLPPDYEQLRGRPLEEIVAFQWRAANETILDDLQHVQRDLWTTVSYEDLVQEPRLQIERLLEFSGLSIDPRLAEYLSMPLPYSRHTQTAPGPDKWRKNAAEIDRILPTLTAISARLGR